jgi:hypothetical protein
MAYLIVDPIALSVEIKVGINQARGIYSAPGYIVLLQFAVISLKPRAAMARKSKFRGFGCKMIFSVPKISDKLP